MTAERQRRLEGVGGELQQIAAARFRLNLDGCTSLLAACKKRLLIGVPWGKKMVSVSPQHEVLCWYPAHLEGGCQRILNPAFMGRVCFWLVGFPGITPWCFSRQKLVLLLLYRLE